MSAGAQTKIFGMRLGVDPKILTGGLLALAVFLFWFNSRSTDDAPSSAGAQRANVANAPAPVMRSHLPTHRSASNANDRGTLRVQAVDASRGDIDPTLRLDLLQRVRKADAELSRRNLFDSGPSAVEAAQNTKPIRGPIIPVKPLPPQAPAMVPNAPPPVNIPFKYYGFAKAPGNRVPNRGFFLDGDNVVMANEGELLQRRYLIVALTPASARVEDTQMKQEQTLPLMPEALVQ